MSNETHTKLTIKKKLQTSNTLEAIGLWKTPLRCTNLTKSSVDSNCHRWTPQPSVLQFKMGPPLPVGQMFARIVIESCVSILPSLGISTKESAVPLNSQAPSSRPIQNKTGFFCLKSYLFIFNNFKQLNILREEPNQLPRGRVLSQASPSQRG